MGKIIVFIIAAAMTTTPAFAISNGTFEATREMVGAAPNMSIKILKAGSEFYSQLAGNLFEFSYAAGKASSELVVKGFAKGSKVSTVVLTTASHLAEGSFKAEVASTVVTDTGELIKGSLDLTSKFLEVSVKTTGKIFTWGSNQVVGSAKWSGKAIKSTAKFFLNASGQILDASGNVHGEVVHAAGEVVKFVSETSGKLFNASAEVASIIITASSEVISKAANFSGEAVNAILYGAVDVGLIVIATSAADNKSSEILLWLRADMLYAAFYSAQVFF